jgi:hypothetical protein
VVTNEFLSQLMVELGMKIPTSMGFFFVDLVGNGTIDFFGDEDI